MLDAKKSVETIQAIIEQEGVQGGSDSPLLRTPSYKEAVLCSERVFFAHIPVENVRAGFQSSLRFFIAITAQIFFMKQNKELLSKHVSLATKTFFLFHFTE